MLLCWRVVVLLLFRCRCVDGLFVVVCVLRRRAVVLLCVCVVGFVLIRLMCCCVVGLLLLG